MIDTVQIRIDGKRFITNSRGPFIPMFSRRKYDELSEVERSRFNAKAPYLRKFTLHPLKDSRSQSAVHVEVFEKANHSKEKIEYDLTIKTSLPKLIFSNNLDELAASDGPCVFEELKRRLFENEITVTTNAIATASISVCHFAKNIVLPADIKTRSIIRALAKTDMGKAYDVSDDQHIKDANNGRSLRLACGVRGWSFYEKIEEMQRPTKRGAAGRQTEYERDMVGLYGLDDLEVFRMEYRLNTTQTIKSEINALIGREYEVPVTLDNIFSESLWKTILTGAWRKLISRPDNQLALLSADNKLDLLNHILKQARSRDKSAHSQNQALWCYGLATAIIDHGAKAVRQDCSRIWSGKAEERFEEKVRTAAELVAGVPVSDGIAFITGALERFERVSLKSIQQRIITSRV